MDVQKNKEEVEMKRVRTVAYNDKDDEDVMNAVNNYADAYNKHVAKKTPPRNALRNLLLRILPRETAAITGNGGQLAGQG